jgi:hypothetical protein
MFGWSLEPTGVKNTSVSSAWATGTQSPPANARAANTAEREVLWSVLMEDLEGRFVPERFVVLVRMVIRFRPDR